MCGIFGALRPLPDDVIARVSAALAHRGPDAEGRYADDRITLVHRRLRIIDLSEAGAQPMGNADGSIQVVFNGEIYNHQSLRRELESAYAFRGRCDTEVIVHGYEAWGDSVIERIDGMFALAIWDRRRGRLLIARDRAGKKPLFYTRQGGSFAFASTIAALHESGVPRDVAIDALPYYLSLGFVPPPLTLHAGVRQLPPASTLVREADGSERVQSYWSPQFVENRTPDSFEGSAGRVRDLLTAAVERRLESDVPLGAFLSGGIDSTIVVGLMSKLLGSRVQTFSIGFADDPRYNEVEFARIASQAFGTEHTEFTMGPSSFELVEDLIRHHDGPFGDSSAIPCYVVAQMARRHVTVALTGDGGDEIFCGYTRFLAAEAAERMPLWTRKLAGGVLPLLPRASSERSPVARAERFIRGSTLPLADRMARWVSYFPEPRAVLRDDVASRLGSALDEPIEWQRSVFALARGASALSRILEHNYRTYLPDDLLVKADRTSMAHALELRSPFLDTDLVEYAATLPPSYLRRGTQTKRILKHAFRDLLPSSIRTRGKMGFGVPLATWFRGGLKEYLHDHLDRSGARIFEYVDRPAVQRCLADHQGRVADHGQRLWVLLTLELWLRSLGAPRPVADAPPVQAQGPIAAAAAGIRARKKKVLHVITGLGVGGAEVMLYNLVSRSPSDRCDHTVVSLMETGPIGRKIEQTGITVRSLGMRGGAVAPLHNGRRLAKLAALVRREAPDVIQTWMYHANLLGGAAARLGGGVPVVWGVHHTESHPDGTKPLTRWTIRACAFSSRWLPDRIVCCSQATHRVHVDQGYPAETMLVIPNGFDTNSFKPDPEARRAVRQELEIPDRARVIGAVGRFHPQKDFQNLTRAAAILRTTFPDAYFVMCGNDLTESNRDLARFIDEAGVDRRRWRLLGRRDDLHRVDASFDVLALSSAFGEALPMVLGEAMACGVPCVATDVGDSGLIVGDTGLIVPPRDAPALAEALRAMLVLPDDDLRRRGLAARRWIEDHYGLPFVVDQYEKLYEQIGS
jgi:asparagine synthase (glutamine-hydrolysing)